MSPTLDEEWGIYYMLYIIIIYVKDSSYLRINQRGCTRKWVAWHVFLLIPAELRLWSVLFKVNFLARLFIARRVNDLSLVVMEYICTFVVVLCNIDSMMIDFVTFRMMYICRLICKVVLW